jgi:PAS domain S-box-containing protein
MKTFLVSWIFIIVFCNAAYCSSAEGKKNVLYFNSYHHGYRWSDEILEGISEVLSKSEYKVDLQIEYMDSKKYVDDQINSSLFKLYKEKFVGEDFDVIIVSDNHAYNFVIEHRVELFPGVPLVFCGMNDYESADISSGNLTGIVENFDLIGTLEVARRLHPEKTKMVVVIDQSITGRSIEQQIYTMLDHHKVKLDVEFWFKLSLEETQERVEGLTGESFLFLPPWYQTVRGKFYTAEEVLAAIYAHSSVPIYTSWEFLLGHGAVGGRLLSGFDHGRSAAEFALRILGGERAEDIPVVVEPAGEYKFDYQVMQKLKINQKLLPQGSVIINSPEAFYALPKELFWTIMISIFLLVIVLIFLVITMVERRKVQRKVLEQLSFQGTLMDTIPQLVSWKDLSGKYLGANRTFTDFFGVETPDGVVSKTTRDLVKDQDYVQWSTEADAEVVTKQQEFRKFRKKISDHVGNVGWLEVSKVPLRNQAGRIIGILTSAENVTKEQNLEKQLLQSQKMEAIGTLAGGIAHDFNNILTSIINSTELALGDVEYNSQTARDLQRVLKAARRGSSVVKQILSFSRPSKEGFKPTDLGTVIHEVLSLMDASLPSNISVQSNISSNGILVNADPTQVHQVVLNLCTNAFHALRATGGVLRVSAEAVLVDTDLAATMNIMPGEYMKISVGDDGPGIDPGIIDNIFDPFFSTKDITEGTGLGLSVVHGIVKGHRGGLRVESKLGEGTQFEIYLPQTEGLSPLPFEDGVSRYAQSLAILFVEDDEDQLNAVPRVLKSLGHKVTAMDDPQKAIDLVTVKGEKFDLVICDYDMPSMRGTMLAEILCDLPFVLVSGREDSIAAAMPYGNIRKVLIKPYAKEELKRVLDLMFN